MQASPASIQVTLCTTKHLLDIAAGFPALDVVLDRHKIHYLNPKYGRDLKVFVGRKSRRSSIYYADISGETLCGWGNNITVGFESFENLGGNYVPLLFNMKMELCKFYEEQYLGKPLVAQLPKNLSTCPVHAGWYRVTNVNLGFMENFPYNLPLTYGAVEARGRLDFKGHVTATKELVYYVSIYGHVVQKPRNKRI